MGKFITYKNGDNEVNPAAKVGDEDNGKIALFGVEAGGQVRLFRNVEEGEASGQFQHVAPKA